MESRDGLEECGNPHQDKPFNVKKTRSPLLIPKGNRGDYMRIFLSASGNTYFLLVRYRLADVFLLRGFSRLRRFFGKLLRNVRKYRLFSALGFALGDFRNGCRSFFERSGPVFRLEFLQLEQRDDFFRHQAVDFGLRSSGDVFRRRVRRHFRECAGFRDFRCRRERIRGGYDVFLGFRYALRRFRLRRASRSGNGAAFRNLSRCCGGRSGSASASAARGRGAAGGSAGGGLLRRYRERRAYASRVYRSRSRSERRGRRDELDPYLVPRIHGR